MAWLYKRTGSNKWWLGYRINGKQILRSTKTADLTKAQKELAKLNALDQANQAGSLTDEFYRHLSGKQPSDDTLIATVKLWLSECRGSNSPKTVERYESIANDFCRYLKANEEAPRLREVRQESIAEFLRAKRATTSVSTARLTRTILGAFFKYALENQRIVANPMPTASSLKLASRDVSERRAFTLEELKLLYDKAPDDFWRYMILAGFYCGQRLGDLACITWGASDFSAGIIRMFVAKTGKTLKIPMRAELRKLLSEVKSRAGKVKPNDFIWAERAAKYKQSGAGPLSNEFYDLILVPCGLVPARDHKRKHNKVGIDRRKPSEVSFHCLRHTFVTLLKATGGTQAVAKELAGHSSDKMSDLYTHVPEAALADAINKLPEFAK